MSTTLPHGIIQINEGNISWYGDITANWQLIDSKIGVYDAAIATIPAPANNGTLTINYGGSTIAMFGADDAGNVSADIPAPGDGTLTIQRNGTTIDTFTANASVDKTIDISTVDDTKIPLAGSNAISGDLIPSTDGTVNLGGTSYQWNNAYIKSLTINGVACGNILTHNVSEFVNVNTAQTVGGQKTFTASPRVTRIFPVIALNISDCDVTETPTESKYASLLFQDKNNKNLAYIVAQQRTDGKKRMCIRAHRTDNINNYYSVDLDSEGDFYPEQTNAINLGTSVFKWKSVYTNAINGLNPGALSLWSGNYISLDTTNFDVTATTIGTFTPTVDGWAVLNITQKNKPFGIWMLWGGYRVTFQSVHHGDDYMIFALIPVRANVTMTVYCTADDIDSTRKIDWLRLFPCQGNV